MSKHKRTVMMKQNLKKIQPFLVTFLFQKLSVNRAFTSTRYHASVPISQSSLSISLAFRLSPMMLVSRTTTLSSRSLRSKRKRRKCGNKISRKREKLLKRVKTLLQMRRYGRKSMLPTSKPRMFNS